MARGPEFCPESKVDFNALNTFKFMEIESTVILTKKRDSTLLARKIFMVSVLDSGMSGPGLNPG